MLDWLSRLFNRITCKKLKNLGSEEIFWRAVYSSFHIKDNGQLKPGFFKDKNGLSCDMALYTTVKRALYGAQKPPRPNGAGLSEFSAKDTRSKKVNSDVEHKPICNVEKLPEKDNSVVKLMKNYAHCQFTTCLSTGEARALINLQRYRVKPDVKEIRLQKGTK